jgi:hypothetical protein
VPSDCYKLITNNKNTGAIMKISIVALLTLCASCAWIGYLFGKLKATRAALNMALNISSVFDLHLEPIEPVKPLYHRGASEQQGNA